MIKATWLLNQLDIPATGEVVRCLTQTLTPAGHYGLDVVPEGGGDCGGACNYNRYALTVQLSTP